MGSILYYLWEEERGNLKNVTFFGALDHWESYLKTSLSNQEESYD